MNRAAIFISCRSLPKACTSCGRYPPDPWLNPYQPPGVPHLQVLCPSCMRLVLPHMRGAAGGSSSENGSVRSVEQPPAHTQEGGKAPPPMLPSETVVRGGLEAPCTAPPPMLTSAGCTADETAACGSSTEDDSGLEQQDEQHHHWQIPPPPEDSGFDDFDIITCVPHSITSHLTKKQNASALRHGMGARPDDYLRTMHEGYPYPEQVSGHCAEAGCSSHSASFPIFRGGAEGEVDYWHQEVRSANITRCYSDSDS